MQGGTETEQRRVSFNCFGGPPPAVSKDDPREKLRTLTVPDCARTVFSKSSASCNIARVCVVTSKPRQKRDERKGAGY
jgi:hypothetical protein